jgi:hypothetical protein
MSFGGPRLPNHGALVPSGTFTKIQVETRMKTLSQAIALACMSACVLTASMSSVHAGPRTTNSVLFKDFQKETKCNASDTKGKVSLKKKRGHPKVEIKGYPDVCTLYCNLPDGRTVISDINKKVRKDARVVGVTVYPDGRAFVTSSTEASGLVSEEFTKMIRVAK